MQVLNMESAVKQEEGAPSQAPCVAGGKRKRESGSNAEEQATDHAVEVKEEPAAEGEPADAAGAVKEEAAAEGDAAGAADPAAAAGAPHCTCGLCLEGWLSPRTALHLGLLADSARWACLLVQPNSQALAALYRRVSPPSPLLPWMHTCLGPAQRHCCAKTRPSIFRDLSALLQPVDRAGHEGSRECRAPRPHRAPAGEGPCERQQEG